MKESQEQLFLAQSYDNAWEEYNYVLNHKRAVRWDWVVITASNEKQAGAYREQINWRQENGFLPRGTAYVVIADPEGKRVGSGGATLNVLKYIAEHTEKGDPFFGKRILVIHSGGDSKRVPQYSACGKLFAPVPRELPNGQRSALFDEFMIMLAGVAPRMSEGMLVISGDIVLLFNPLQIDLKHKGAAALSIKEPVKIGVEHGVFQTEDGIKVNKFLHKQEEEVLRREGAVNERGSVDLDTGTIWFDGEMLHKLYGLIASEGQADAALYKKYINDKIRLSFYGDFLYPLAESATLEEYLEQEAEGEKCEELWECRRELWEILHETKLGLIRMSPARYIHFGTTRELSEQMNSGEKKYGYLGWRKNVLSNRKELKNIACNNSLIDQSAVIGAGSYLEDSDIGAHTTVKRGAILSNVRLEGEMIPGELVLHGIRYEDGSHVTRIYGIDDNPKGDKDSSFLGGTLRQVMEQCGIEERELWDGEEQSLWTAKLYPECREEKESIRQALLLWRMSRGEAAPEEIQAWKRSKRSSLMESFHKSDTREILKWQRELEDQIRISCFLEQVKQKEDVHQALTSLSRDRAGMLRQAGLLLKESEKTEDSLKIRIYLGLSFLVKSNRLTEFDYTSEELEDLCYQTINRKVKERTLKCYHPKLAEHIALEEVTVEMPVRVNWCGGPSDAPPYCLEMGGAVINAAISLRGELPVKVTAKRLQEKEICLESRDLGYRKGYRKIEEIRDCIGGDAFSLHKACLLAAGIIPMEGEMTLEEALERIGGGIYLSTSVDVPMGSGLGTSSILAAACIKAVNRLTGQSAEEEKIYAQTLCAEQLMDTGGGWQDQVGGATEGIKLITSEPGVPQDLNVDKLELTEEVKAELQERYVLIFSGQRRLAKNILRQEMNRYIMYEKYAVEMIHEVQQLAVMSRFELERGNIEELAKLLDRQWELLKGLDKGSSNMCIEQIFTICDDLIAGRSICGAGGGGFLQVILKKGVKKEMLAKRLQEMFQDCGVAIWDCEFV